MAPALGFQKVPDPTPGKNNVHLDFRAADREAEVARLVDLGARETGRHNFGPDFDWVVLADPEGNAFCVAGRLSRRRCARLSRVTSGLTQAVDTVEHAADHPRPAATVPRTRASKTTSTSGSARSWAAGPPTPSWRCTR